MIQFVIQNDIYFKCHFGHISQKRLYTSQKSDPLKGPLVIPQDFFIVKFIYIYICIYQYYYL